MRLKALAATALMVLALALAGADRPEPPTRVERPALVLVERVDHVIGNGSPASIRLEDLRAAFREGGSITFNTGGKPVTIPITERLVMSQHAKPIVMDGLGLVTFDGGERSQIIFKEWKTELTIQRCTFVNARGEERGAIESAWDGRLTLIECDFRNCKTTSDGPDIGGGAICTKGQKHLLIADCTFVDCAGSNGGAVRDIGSQKSFIGCTFKDCVAFGRGGGKDQGPTGRGGIGGAVYGDGVDQAGGTPMWYFEDCLFVGNRAYDHAGAVFAYTRPNQDNVTIFAGCMFVDNAVERPDGSDPHIQHGGAVYNQYTALHVIGCTFVDNRTPGIGGTMFTAGMRSVRVAMCDGQGNRSRGKPFAPEDIASLGTPPAAVVWNGRRPGRALPEQRSELREPQAEADEPAAAKRAPQPTIDQTVHLAWRQRLIARLRARLEAGAELRFISRTVGGKEATLRAVDEARVTLATREMTLPLGWDRVPGEDRLALARLLLESEPTAEDHALVSWYGFLHGDVFKAKEHLVQAGDLQERINADLGR